MILGIIKVGILTPTFRYSSKMGYQDVEDAKIVPILHSEDFIKITDYLKEKGEDSCKVTSSSRLR